MALETSPRNNVDYYLVPFDADGVERGSKGVLTSDVIIDRLESGDFTDVFVFSHGWNGDIGDARSQYGKWLDTMADADAHNRFDPVRPAGFKPLLIGLHWPSKAWGDESLTDISADGWTRATAENFSRRIGDTAPVRDAIQTIVDAAKRDLMPPVLPDEVRDAYVDLNDNLGIGAGGLSASPADDRDPFDPELAYQATLLADISEPVAFGTFTPPNGVLGPLRLLSFWTMKRRAMLFGQSGASQLLMEIRRAAKGARLHLAGHSFGCIAASAAVAGKPEFPAPGADSLVLLQGALSLWSYSADLPANHTGPGYFRRVIGDNLVRGPIVATTSVHDRAVRVSYPLAAGVVGQIDFAPKGLPVFGGVGTFGICGSGINRFDGNLEELGDTYDLEPGRVHNLNANNTIKKNMSFFSGAHSDICQPAVARAVWRAVERAG